MDSEADYVIIGAGSAGCVVANRLSAGRDQVAILEAGGRDDHYLLRVPAAALNLRGHPTFDWRFVTEKAKGAAERVFDWPRGKVVGGSSSINGMNFVRGLPSDYDDWAASGCQGWSFEDVLPHFKSMEAFDGGSDALRGRSGPLRVQAYATILPLTHALVEAAQQSGFPLFADLNAATGEGVGYSQMARNGRFRASSARAFLAPALSRPNLRLETDAMALGLRFEGRRCVGVRYRQHGVEKTLHARRDVIVCAGAIGSPHLLQVSGIGPAAHLRSIGVNVVHDLPGVGENLHDHYASTVSHRVKNTLTLNDYVGSWRLVPSALKWALFSSGPFTFGGTTATTYARSRPDIPNPDIQLLFLPGIFTRHPSADRETVALKGMRFSISAAKPKSRGRIRARSASIEAHPAIDPGYLTAPEDIETLKHGVRIARRIFDAPALAAYLDEEVAPGPKLQSDAELDRYIRATGHSAYHPAGSCKMGTDAMAVVDPGSLRVHGVDGLRVVDASIMPVVPSGNINAPVTMIGEKGAALIRVGS